MFGLGKKKEAENVTTEVIPSDVNTTESPEEKSQDVQITAVTNNSDAMAESLPVEIKLPDSPEPETYEPLPLGMKEMKALKRAQYEEKIKPNFSKTYVLFNKKTGQIAGIKGASSHHACNIIGWRPRAIQVLEVIDDDQPETTSQSVTDESKE